MNDLFLLKLLLTFIVGSSVVTLATVAEKFGSKVGGFRGMVNVVVFAVAARYFFLLSGLILGTILAYIISGISAYGTYIFIKAKMT